MDAVTYQPVHEDNVLNFNLNVEFSSEDESLKSSEDFSGESSDDCSDNWDENSDDGLRPESLPKETVIEVLHTDEEVFVNEIKCVFKYYKVSHNLLYDSKNYEVAPYADTKSSPDLSTFYLSTNNLARKSSICRSSSENLAVESSDQKSENLAKKVYSGIKQSLARRTTNNLARKSKIENDRATGEDTRQECYIQFHKIVDQFLKEGRKYLIKLEKLCKGYTPKELNKDPFDHVMDIVIQIYDKTILFYRQLGKVELNEKNVVPILDKHVDIYEMYVLFDRVRNKANRTSCEGRLSRIEFTLSAIDNQIDKHIAAFTDWKTFIVESDNKETISKIIVLINSKRVSIQEHSIVDPIKYNPFTSKDHGRILRTFCLRLNRKYKKCCVVIFEQLIIFANQVAGELQFLDFLTLDSIETIKEDITLLRSYKFKIVITLAPDVLKFGRKFIELSGKHGDSISSCYATLHRVLQDRP